MKSLRAALTLSALVLPSLALASTWELDSSHSNATFTVRHMMLSNVHGELGKVSGTVELDDKDLTKSSVQATIDMAGLNTHEEKRDAHLKSPDFFDVAKHPSLTFKSKRVEKGAGNHLKVTGDLTIRDVTKEVVLDVEPSAEVAKDPFGMTRRAATATTKINRSEYGLKWNKALEGGGVLVGDEVNISLDVEMTKKAAGKKS